MLQHFSKLFILFSSSQKFSNKLGINGYVPQACWGVRVLQHPGIKEKESSKRQAQFKKAQTSGPY